MEIKTKYNEEEVVYFLTKNTDLCDRDVYSKIGEVFICEAIIISISIDVEDGKTEITNHLQTTGTRAFIKIDENFCAPDITQLANDVANRYFVSKNNKKK